MGAASFSPTYFALRGRTVGFDTDGGSEFFRDQTQGLSMLVKLKRLGSLAMSMRLGI